MQQQEFDTIVVGSGPGGASTALALARQGKRVAIVEMGRHEPLQGSFMQMAKMAALPGKGAFIHSDLSLVMRAITTGGSATINFATAMRPPLSRFQALGIDLSSAQTQLHALAPIAPLPDHLVGPMASRIEASALSLGMKWQRLNKFIHLDQCRLHCHRCTYGCPYQAKWSARALVEQALEQGATLFEQASVEKVIHHQQQTQGVQVKQKSAILSLYAKQVVLAAGGIGSPRILAASGFDHASQNYFVDPVIAVMGKVKGLKGGSEVPMAAGLHLPEQGITLSDLALPRPLHQLFAAQVGRINSLMSHSDTLCIMVKIADQPGGRIGPRWINKSLTSQDKARLQHGRSLAEQILNAAGASRLYQSHHFAAHPGGSAAIGHIVDCQLQTRINGLYVCDASVLPGPWGIAPSYTLLCLGLRLADHLLGKPAPAAPSNAAEVTG